MRDVGSDENYITLHVAFSLALQKVFEEQKRPVPGLLVFDQLSRAYFPADEHHDRVNVDISGKQDEREKLKQYFDLLFDEVEQSSQLQVLVLEHAYFANDSRFTSSVIEEWYGENKLVPLDWPLIDEI